MNNTIKKVSAYILISLVLLTTTVAVLEIWGIHHIFDIKAIFWRLMQSLLVIFCSSAVLLFIFAVILKEKKEE